MVNLVILLAGESKRFKIEGFQQSKAFIDIDGHPMIARVFDNVRLIKQPFRAIFICLKKDEQHVKDLFSKFSDTILTVDKVTRGAAETALQIKGIVDPEDELVITDTDHLVLDTNHIERGIQYFRKHRADGGLWNFLSDDSKYSYVRISNGKINEVAEKSVISNLANTGSFYWRHAKYFVSSAEDMINRDIRVKGEYYLSQIYPRLIADGMKILPYMTNEFIGLGTPSDVKSYLNSIK